MAFFSRRKREDSEPDRSREGASEPTESTDAPKTDDDATSSPEVDAAEAAASVNISMSSFRGLGGGQATPTAPRGSDASSSMVADAQAARPGGAELGR